MDFVFNELTNGRKVKTLTKVKKAAQQESQGQAKRGSFKSRLLSSGLHARCVGCFE